MGGGGKNMQRAGFFSPRGKKILKTPLTILYHCAMIKQNL
jgi:hypothetical protein